MSAQAGGRMLDQGTAPDRFARGWHCLGLADSFRTGEPHGIDAFGTRLVVWSDSAGAIHVVDGYCRHMGADLSRGSVKDDRLACPFHGWQWAGDGRCAAIPYAKRVPLRARTRSWQTCEQNGQLFVWNDAEGGAPIQEQAIPSIAGIDADEFSSWTWSSVHIENAHCREIIDNNVDMAHFFYVHFAYPTSFRNVFEGHTASQFMSSKARPDVHDAPAGNPDQALLRSEATYYGPSYMIDRLSYDIGGATIESVLINCHYPVTHDSFVLQWGVAVRRLPGMERDSADRLAERFSRHFGEGFLQDVEIWRSKVPVQNPLLCEEDGPLYQHRRWYEQFYVDRAAISDDMIALFEFEVDTTHANAVWQAEVAANLAAVSPGPLSPPMTMFDSSEGNP